HGAVVDRPGVRYQSVASYAPQNGVTDWFGAMRSPWSALSATIFTALRKVTAREDPRYPCAGEGTERRIFEVLGDLPPAGSSDGVVPLLSQVYGDLIWVGKADHLD